MGMMAAAQPAGPVQYTGQPTGPGGHDAQENANRDEKDGVLFPVFVVLP